MPADKRNPRYWTVQVLEAMESGILDPKVVAEMALNWLSEADVYEMLSRNDLDELLVGDYDDGYQ